MTQSNTNIVESEFSQINSVEANKNDLCANCHTPLSGKFCHSCGQSSKSMIKFFGEVIKELLDDALGYDSRFKHSLMPLLFKPGRLTLDYVKGKRFHYVLPFKLYLITSVLFILLIKNTTDTDVINFDDGTDQQEQAEPLNREEKKEKAKEKIEEVFENLSMIDDDVKEELLEAVEDQKKDTVITIGVGKKDIDLNWNEETQQLDGVDEIESEFLRTFFTRINPKIKLWKNDSKPLVDSIIETLPYMMFIMLPIFALFLKLFYLFSKRFYTEHLVFLLHNHSFMFLVIMLQLGLTYGELRLIKVEDWFAQTTAGIFGFISMLLTIWIVIYVFLAMKRFYNQSWKMTILKTFMLGFVYFIMLATGFMFTLAFGAYQA